MNKTSVQILYNNLDITSDVSSDLISIKYTDHDGGQADDLQITLADVTNKWIAEWYPDKGASLDVTISTTKAGKTRRLKTGSFEIDEISNTIKPSTVTIKASSISTQSPIKTVKKTKAYEMSDLKDIAALIAYDADILLNWQGSPTPKQKRINQRDESDLFFLNRIAKQYHHRVKMINNTLVVWDEQKTRQSPPIKTISTSQMTNPSFTSVTKELYASARVRYRDPETKKDIDYTAQYDRDVGTNRVLNINRRVETIDQARQIAQKELAEKNRIGTTANINLQGDPDLVAGVVIDITDAGVYNGSYIIQQADHSYTDKGYRVTAKVNRV